MWLIIAEVVDVESFPDDKFVEVNFEIPTKVGKTNYTQKKNPFSPSICVQKKLRNFASLWQEKTKMTYMFKKHCESSSCEILLE